MVASSDGEGTTIRAALIGEVRIWVPARILAKKPPARSNLRGVFFRLKTKKKAYSRALVTFHSQLLQRRYATPCILVDSCSIAEQILGERWPGLKPVKEYRENGYHVYKLVANCSGSRCPKCVPMCYKPHARQWREALDAPLQPHDKTKIVYQIRRFHCSCGCHFTERLEFLEPRARLTKSMTLYSQQLMRCSTFTLSDLRLITGLSVTTLKKIDKVQLNYPYSKVDLSSVQNLAIDEFSVFHNHKYATVVIDNDTCKVLWVGRGKSK